MRPDKHTYAHAHPGSCFDSRVIRAGVPAPSSHFSYLFLPLSPMYMIYNSLESNNHKFREFKYNFTLIVNKIILQFILFIFTFRLFVQSFFSVLVFFPPEIHYSVLPALTLPFFSDG